MGPTKAQHVVLKGPFDGPKDFEIVSVLGAHGAEYVRCVKNSSSNVSCPRTCGRNTSLVENDAGSPNSSDPDSSGSSLISMLGWSLGFIMIATRGSLKGCKMSSTGVGTSGMIYREFCAK